MNKRLMPGVPVLRRRLTKCLLRPPDIPPSSGDMEVIGAFNPGAVAVDDSSGDGTGGEQVVLLVRVAERPLHVRSGCTALPRYETNGRIVVDQVPNDRLAYRDPRVVRVQTDTGMPELRLTFVSHLRVVRSTDGQTIDSVDGPCFRPQTQYETYGVEDPRITRIGDRFYFTYVAVSPHGAATALASTTDFIGFERHGIIFQPENKDVLLFPEKIGGKFVAIHRPNPSMNFSQPQMWLARSTDLLRWGDHQFLFAGGSGGWRNVGRVGGGCPPVRTDGGWLEIYHGNVTAGNGNSVGTYCGGAFMMDLDDPGRIVAHCDGPIMVPEAEFETQGFLPDIVFPTALIERGDAILVYYGAADSCTGVVAYDRSELLAQLR